VLSLALPSVLHASAALEIWETHTMV
jgi:hypothetical protein